MNERNFDFSALSERISAQTEAAVEFSNALVRIIEQTAAIRDKINDSNVAIKDELKTISNKVQDILSDYTKFNSENSNQHGMFEKDLEVLEEKINAYEKQLKELLDSTEINSATLNNSVADLIKYSKRTLDQIASNNQANMQEFFKSSDAQNKFMQDVQKQLHSQNEMIGSFHKEIASVKSLFMTISTISVIIGILTALNIIHISWFVK
jgi:DNA repair exonuclease SbcCD ATPase subunit